MDSPATLATPSDTRVTNKSTPLDEHGDREQCTICLSPITERAVAVPCDHLSFDFLCLVQWLQTSARCPLCQATVTEVQYDFRSVTHFSRYIVPQALIPSPVTNTPQEHRRHSLDREAQAIDDPALHFRRLVYEQLNYSLHVGSSLHSGYSDFPSSQFAASPELQSRSRTFLRRELQAIENYLQHDQAEKNTTGRYSRRHRGLRATIDYLIEFIVAILRSHELRSHDARAEELVAEFLPIDITRLLLHELHSWLRSPYTRLREWDEVVQYVLQPTEHD